ncbi:hypothetical protein E3N88_08033 [Mikania micrantha]|uniref:Uncharacterized protein n=1 Tax=Mikania micrantha TaxID=192012 RepID=A0A5N6PG59_9ASTR|nr:hypothetical protein E3N88_08033 [Mikania micrantha]
MGCEGSTMGCSRVTMVLAVVLAGGARRRLIKATGRRRRREEDGDGKKTGSRRISVNSCCSPFLHSDNIEPFPSITMLELSPNLTLPPTLVSKVESKLLLPVMWFVAPARAAALETKFCNLNVSACSSVDDYCQQLYDIANQLADVDQPVFESRLLIQLVRVMPIEYNTTAALINQHGLDWDQAITMLKDEVIRVEARQGPSPTLLAAPAAPPQPNQHPSHHFSPSCGRGRGRGSWNHLDRGRGGGRSTFSPWSSNQPSYPNWAWWTPPPCPYPTQSTWRPPTTESQPSLPPTPHAQFASFPQAQFAGHTEPPLPSHNPPPYGDFNALCPSDLSAAFAHTQDPSEFFISRLQVILHL